MKKSLISYLYVFIWIVPFYVFGRDFFYVEDIIKEVNTSTLRLIMVSFKQGILTALLSFVAAILPAYYVTYRRGRLSTLIEGSIFIPFFFPVISTVVAFSIIFNSRLLEGYSILYTLTAILTANVFYNAPLFVKYLSQGMKKIPRELIEAGRECGASTFEIFFKIKLPLILPQVLRAFFLVFVYSFTSFGIVLSMGGLRYSTLEVEIANTLMGSLDFSRVFTLGLIQFAILTGINSVIERVENYELKGEEAEGRVGWFTTVYSVVFLIAEMGVVATSLVFSFYNYYESKFTLTVFKRLFSREFNKSYPVIESIFNSLMVSGVTALIVVIFSYILLKNYRKINSYIIFSTFGISSAFLAISLVYINILYEIPYLLLLVTGYFLTSIPLAYSFMYQYIKKFPKDVSEAAEVDGAGRIQKFFYIELPMLKDILISTYFQIFAIIYAEFTITYTMQLGREFPLASLVNYSLASHKLFLESSAMSTLNIMIIGSIFLMANIKRKR